MRNFYISFALLVCVVGVSPLSVCAQQNESLPTEETLTLEQCIEKAMASNYQIKSAQMEVSRMTFVTKGYFAKVLPSISANADYKYNLEIPATLVPSAAFGGRAGEYATARFGLAQSLSAGLNLDQVLFNNAAFIGLKAIKPLRERSKMNLQEVQDVVTYNVASVFYSIQILDMQKALIHSNLLHLERILANLSSLATQEAIAQNDVDKLTIQMDKLKSQNIEIAQTQFTLYNTLKVLMGSPLKSTIQIVPKTAEELAEFSLLIPPPATTNIRQVRINQINLDLLKVERAASLSAFLPTLSLRASYFLTGYNTTFNPIQAYQGQWFPSSFIGVSFHFPLFDGEGTFLNKTKTIEIKKAQNDFELFKSDLEKQMQDAFSNYQSKKEIQIHRKRIFEMQQKVMQNEEALFETGLTTLSALLKAQDDLSSERTDYIKSLVELKRSELDYKKLINEISKK